MDGQRKQTANARRTCIVIIEVQSGDDRQDVGVVVDAVSEVLEIAAENIEAVPGLGANIRADFIQGMGKVQDKFIIILNINNML